MGRRARFAYMASLVVNCINLLCLVNMQLIVHGEESSWTLVVASTAGSPSARQVHVSDDRQTNEHTNRWIPQSRKAPPPPPMRRGLNECFSLASTAMRLITWCAPRLCNVVYTTLRKQVLPVTAHLATRSTAGCCNCCGLSCNNVRSNCFNGNRRRNKLHRRLVHATKNR